MMESIDILKEALGNREWLVDNTQLYSNLHVNKF